MIVERCGCGATIAVDVPGTFRATEERRAVAIWRAEHVHTAAQPATPSDRPSTGVDAPRG